MIIVANKPLGWTPLQVIDDIRSRDERYRESKMVYAGRLDPMAEGLVVILTDEDRFDLEEHLKHDKSYTSTMLFGFKSDSLDALGIVERMAGSSAAIDGKIVSGTIEGLVGDHEIEFPKYSAYKIKGKPLHWWAKEGRIDEVEIPKKNMTVNSVRIIKTETRNVEDILLDVTNTIGLVSGDFRQDEVIASWERALEGVDEVLVVTAEFDVTSGTYIRSLVDLAGRKIGSGALLLHLNRTRIGEFTEPTER